MVHQKIHVSIAVTAALLFGSAAQAQTPPVATPAAIAGALKDYRLGVGDKVRLSVYGEDALKGDFAVPAAGTISFPLVGDITALNRTISDVQQEIEGKLRAGFILEPRVAAEVLTYRPFYILGEVNRPGEYPYQVGLTVTNAVATAQGYTYRANKKKVFIRRETDAREQGYAVSSNVAVQPGDTIRIGERYF